MKRNWLILLIGIISLSSCKQTVGPVDTMKEFVEAMGKMDHQKARSLLTNKLSNYLDPFEEEAKTMSEEKKAEVIKKVSKNKMSYELAGKSDTAAVVIVKIEPSTTNPKQRVFKSHLKKLDNKWLIDKFEED